MEILTNLQKKILLLFSKLLDKEAFYLTGGTALSAFFLKHRSSKDLDFLTHVEELILPFSQKLEESLKKEAHLLTRPCSMKELKDFFGNWRKEILKKITDKR